VNSPDTTKRPSVAVLAAFLATSLLVAAGISTSAFSQRMMIYNTTGNSTDAMGQMAANNLQDLKGILNTSIKESKSTIVPKNTTGSSYPSSFTVSIVKGAALKRDQAFYPNPVFANRGGVVTWFNNDTVTHTVTSGIGITDPEKGKEFDSGLLGGMYKHKFDQAGNFTYFCQVHPTMVGKVVVVATEKGDLKYSKTNATGTDIEVQNRTLANKDNLANSTKDNVIPASNNTTTATNSQTPNLFDQIVRFFQNLFGLSK